MVGEFDLEYARGRIEQEIEDGRIDPEHVRKYVWYKRWADVAATLPKKGREDVLLTMFHLIDEIHGFGYENTAWHALVALHILLKDV